MFGAMVGDIAGSAYERHSVQSKDFDLWPKGCRFTDDTVLTVAIADALLTKRLFADTIIEHAKKQPYRGYGHRFRQWMDNPSGPYNSFGNGSAMRVSPIGWWFDTQREVEEHAEASAAPTHNHPEGIKGAVAVAVSIWMARSGVCKNDIKDYLTGKIGYQIRTVEEIRSSGYSFDSSCQGSVPEALSAFLESESYEDAVRNAIYLRGDSDTQAAIAGSVAEAFYGGVPKGLKTKACEYLQPSIAPIVLRFDEEVVQEKLWVSQKGVDADGRAWLTPRMEKAAAATQAAWNKERA